MNDDQTSGEPTQPLSGWQPSREEGVSSDPGLIADPPPAPGSWAPQQPSDAAPTQPLLQGPPAGAQHQSAQQPFGTTPYGGAPAGSSYAGQSAYFGPPGTRPMPAQPSGRDAGRTKSGSGMSWPAVAGLSLIVGLLGGLAGATIESGLDEPDGPVSSGLSGVQTRSAAPLSADNGSIPAVAQALLPSTVQIVAAYGGDDAGATGSGFVLDREGHIVTNNHVVAGAASDEGPITVIDQAGKRHKATVVGRSNVYDLAVLAVEGAEDLEPAALGSSTVLNVGDPVIAFGAPLGLSQTVTSGIVSALNRPVTTSGESENESSYINAVQTDAAINPGNSGGPLVNLAGEVVGVNSAIATTGGGLGSESGNIGVGFAIPIEQVRITVDQILRTGRAEYPVIGANVNTRSTPDQAGALITGINSGSPAEKSGLRKDDVVLSVDGQLVTDGIALIVAIRTHQPGETVEFNVLRDEKEVTLKVELDGEVG